MGFPLSLLVYSLVYSCWEPLGEALGGRRTERFVLPQQADSQLGPETTCLSLVDVNCAAVPPERWGSTGKRNWTSESVATEVADTILSLFHMTI